MTIRVPYWSFLKKGPFHSNSFCWYVELSWLPRGWPPDYRRGVSYSGVQRFFSLLLFFWQSVRTGSHESWRKKKNNNRKKRGEKINTSSPFVILCPLTRFQCGGRLLRANGFFRLFCKGPNLLQVAKSTKNLVYAKDRKIIGITSSRRK